MKVTSLYKYRLPGRIVLEKGVSELGELPPPAKKYLAGLIASGEVTVLDEPKSAKAAKPESAKVESKPAEPKAEAPPVEASTRRDQRKTTDDK
jgi:hypothetical protein